MMFECSRQNILNYLCFQLFAHLIPFISQDNKDFLPPQTVSC